MARFSIRTMAESAKVAAVAMCRGWPARHPSPKKSPALRIATTPSLPCRDTTLSLTLPLSM